jgi:hypothetical protein
MKELEDDAKNIEKNIEKRVLRRIFVPKWGEIISWRKLHNEKLYNLNPPPNIIRIIKSWSMRLAAHVARMGRRGMHIRFWWKSQDERNH